MRSKVRYTLSFNRDEMETIRGALSRGGVKSVDKNDRNRKVGLTEDMDV